MMSTLSLTLRDVIWFGTLLVSLALAFGRLKTEIRHLEDVKADSREVQRLGDEIRESLSEIRTSLARMEETMKGASGRTARGRGSG